MRSVACRSRHVLRPDEAIKKNARYAGVFFMALADVGEARRDWRGNETLFSGMLRSSIQETATPAVA